MTTISEETMRPIVADIISKLNDDELRAMHLCILLGNDPRGRDGWEKAQVLWQYTRPDGPPTMHEITRNVWLSLVPTHIS